MDMCRAWYLEMHGTYDASLLNDFLASRMADEGVGGCTVVGRKVELTQGNG